MLKEVLQNNRLDDQVSLFLMAILEYISTDILKLAVDYVKNIHHNHITCQDVKVAMWADKVITEREIEIEREGRFVSCSKNPLHILEKKTVLYNNEKHFCSLFLSCIHFVRGKWYVFWSVSFVAS